MDKYTFGNRLLELRTKRGLTQKELAKIIGVSNKAVSKWETGETMPRVKTMQKLAEVFSTTYADLLSEDGEVKSYSEDELFRKKKVENHIKITKGALFCILFGAIGAMLLKLVSAVMYIIAFEKTDGILNLIGVIVSNLCLIGVFVYLCKKFKFARDNIYTVKYEYFKPVIIRCIVFVSLCLGEMFLLREDLNPAMTTIITYLINILYLLIICKVYTHNKISAIKGIIVDFSVVVPCIANCVTSYVMLERIGNYDDNLIMNLSESEFVYLLESFLVNMLSHIATMLLWVFIMGVLGFSLNAVFVRDCENYFKKKDDSKRNKVLLILLAILAFGVCAFLMVPYLELFFKL